MEISKGRSPFYPGQPVPIELFTGRKEQIESIEIKGIRQVAEGKPIAIYVQGEYGIGKTSIARVMQYLAETKYNLHGIYVSLGGAHTLEEMAKSILEGIVRSGAWEPKKLETIRDIMAKYIGNVELFGISLNMEAIKADAPNIATASSLLSFLSQTLERLRPTGTKGIFLILDEINGIVNESKFSHFIKGLVDTNAVSPKPLPILLMLCGVEEKRRTMIRNFEPIGRIFDIIEIKPLENQEVQSFFNKAFLSINTVLDSEAVELMVHYSAGFPKIMHHIGDSIYWQNNDNVVSKDDALLGVLNAADDIGKKYVDQQVYSELHSKDYRSILQKIGKYFAENKTQGSLKTSEIKEILNESEKKKFNNFLRKMKDLKVLLQEPIKGEYRFSSRMVQLYIIMESLRKNNT